MNDIVKIILIAILAGAVGGFVGGLVGNNQPDGLGNATASFWDVTGAGNYRVDGTVVIDADGNVDAPITSSTGTFSSTLDVTGITSIGTTTPDSVKTLQVDGGTGTGTIAADSSTAELFGGCIEVKSMTASTTFHMYATTTGLALWQTGSCVDGTEVD